MSAAPSDQGATSHERWARGLVFGAIAAGLGARLAFAANDDGIFWPDEIYQSLEPAHRLVFGYGWQAWEFLEGARHWTLPGLVALIFKLAQALGLTYPEGTLALTRAVFCVVSAAVPLGVYRLARLYGATPIDAAIGATASALMALTIYFAPRATGETASAAPLVFGLVATLDPAVARRWRLMGVLLLAAAVFLRLQNAVFCLSVLGVWWAQGRRRHALEALGLFVGAGLVYGLVDLATWGNFLHSFRVYVRFNLIEGKASQFGTELPWFYVKALLLSEGRVVLPLAVLGALAWKRARPLWWVWLPFFVVHSILPHKELRFVYVLVPLLAALGAVGLTEVRARWPNWSVSTSLALLVLTLVSALTYRGLTFGRLGVRNPGPPTLSALDYSGPENRLLMLAGRRADVCGLRITSTEHWRTGGYAYFHKQVPMYGLHQRTGTEQSYSHLIGRGPPPAGTVVARDGEAWLLSLDRPVCETDAAYDWHLE
jgi:GPI mannosyltransferase 3